MKDAWTQVTQSEYPWEREALDYLKRRLPDHEPYRAWANFEFLLDGVVSEVDVLVAVPKGLFLVEIKSWPGRLEGDAGTWRWTRPGATGPKLLDNPYVLANRKAKRLKSLLASGRSGASACRSWPRLSSYRMPSSTAGSATTRATVSPDSTRLIAARASRRAVCRGSQPG